MAAYAIACLDVHGANWKKEYGVHALALLQAHHGRVIEGAAARLREGARPEPGTVMVIEFPTPKHLRNWYRDPSHMSSTRLPASASRFGVLLVDDLPPN